MKIKKVFGSSIFKFFAATAFVFAAGCCFMSVGVSSVDAPESEVLPGYTESESDSSRNENTSFDTEKSIYIVQIV
ncbi:MAG: hypothetical protein R3Y60_01410 [bacterium]